MKRNLFFWVFSILVLSLSCNKKTKETHIILHIVDDETGKPIQDAHAIFYAEYSNGNNRQTHSEIANANVKGKIETTISSYQDNIYYGSGWQVIVFSDDDKFAYKYFRTEPETRNNITVRLTKTAVINLKYHPAQSVSNLDYVSWGVKFQTEYAIIYDCEEFFSYLRRCNIICPNDYPKFSNCDTTIRITCDPLTTKYFWYTSPSGVALEHCSLEKGEVKNVDIFY